MIIIDDYIKGASAWDKLKKNEKGESKYLYPYGSLDDWWNAPDIFTFAPFQFCTVTGDLEGEYIATACLTQVKRGNDAYIEFNSWRQEIRSDPLVPRSVDALRILFSRNNRKEFIQMWDRCVAWQRAMRQGHRSPEDTRPAFN